MFYRKRKISCDFKNRIVFEGSCWNWFREKFHHCSGEYVDVLERWRTGFIKWLSRVSFWITKDFNPELFNPSLWVSRVLNWNTPKSVWKIWQLDEGIPKIWKKLNSHNGLLSYLHNSTANSAHLVAHFCPALVCPQNATVRIQFVPYFWNPLIT